VEGRWWFEERTKRVLEWRPRGVPPLQAPSPAVPKHSSLMPDASPADQERKKRTRRELSPPRRNPIDRRGSDRLSNFRFPFLPLLSTTTFRPFFLSFSSMLETDTLKAELPKTLDLSRHLSVLSKSRAASSLPPSDPNQTTPSELPRERLGQSRKTELPNSEGSELGRPFPRRGSSSEDEGASSFERRGGGGERFLEEEREEKSREGGWTEATMERKECGQISFIRNKALAVSFESRNNEWFERNEESREGGGEEGVRKRWERSSSHSCSNALFKLS